MNTPTTATPAVIPCASLGMVNCPRCKHWSHSMNHDNLCNKCVATILEHYPDTDHAKLILENLELRGVKPEDNPVYDQSESMRERRRLHCHPAQHGVNT